MRARERSASRSPRSRTHLLGWGCLAVTAAAATLASSIVSNAPTDRFPTLLNAPPTRVHLRDAAGAWHAPFIHPWRRVSQLEQTYEEDRSIRVPLRWLSMGRLLSSSEPDRVPLLLLGADGLGRDVFSRLLHGARTSLGLAALSALGALLLGAVIGAIAGYRGGLVDDLVMRTTDVVLVLPMMYVVMALRSVLPLVLPAGAVFGLLASLFAIIGAPTVARGVRGVVRAERSLDHVLAARSLGAGPARILFRHVLPAALGVLVVDAIVLVPGFLVAEATLSYVGYGFPDLVPSWGTMLHDAASVRAFVDFPWLLAPALAIVLVILGIHLSIDAAESTAIS